MPSSFHFTHAIVRKACYSLQTRAIRHTRIDINRARRQHALYMDILQRCGLDVIVLPPEEQYPDSVFVEDCALVIGNTALITRPGRPSRRGEVNEVRRTFQKYNMQIKEVEGADATVDGGDILFTGKEIIVGYSSRTNTGGVEAISKAFPSYDVTTVDVGKILHLKSAFCMAGDDIISCGDSVAAQQIIQQIKLRARFKYQFLTLKDSVANVLFFNGVLVHKTRHICGDKAYQNIVETVKIPRHEISFDEFSKADGCLTCSSILFSPRRRHVTSST